jgi:cellulose biosynthesis protein BcsQ
MSWTAELGAFFESPFGKVVLTLLGSALTAPTVLAFARWYYRSSLRLKLREIDSLSQRLETRDKDLAEEKKTSSRLRREAELRQPEIVELKKQKSELEQRLEQTRQKLGPYCHAYVKLKPEYDKQTTALAEAKALVEQLTCDVGGADETLVNLREELERRQANLDQSARRIRSALKLEGNLWAARALQKVPKFRPLAQRRSTIVSVLNLKGGVGKTTVTAHLGIALARRGYRVLLIDLDLQGSLSQMLIPFEKHEQLVADESLVQHFFSAASADKTEKILEYVQDVFSFPDASGSLGLIAASDNLAYAEMTLTLNWLLREGDRDNRFLLRKALHLAQFGREYDIVLLDCPPLVNISCINALAASDYILVPVTMGRRAIDRVPVLLKRFLRNERFCKHINHNLKVLGLLANRTFREEFTGAERDDWRQLATWSRDAYGHDVNQFQTLIPQMAKDIRDSETLMRAPDPDSRLSQVFASLADEIEQELPSECRRGGRALS